MGKKLRTRRHTVVLNRSRGGDTGITFLLIVFGFLMVIPFWFVVVDSFKPLDELWYWPPRPYVVHPTLKNFSDLIRLMGTSWVPFSRYLFNTFAITILGVLGNLILGSLAAYSLSKLNYPGRNGLFKVIVWTLMFQQSVAAIVLYILFSKFGWMDTWLPILVPQWGSTIGLYLMKNFMDSSIAVEVLESARLDGSSEWNTFLKIAMPMVKPAWLTLIVYSFQSLWVTGASPYVFSEDLKTFYYAIQQVLNAGVTRAGAGAASNVVMMIVPIVVFVISQSQIIETMGSSGMKD